MKAEHSMDAERHPLLSIMCQAYNTLKPAMRSLSLLPMVHYCQWFIGDIKLTDPLQASIASKSDIASVAMPQWDQDQLV